MIPKSRPFFRGIQLGSGPALRPAYLPRGFFVLAAPSFGALFRRRCFFIGVLVGGEARGGGMWRAHRTWARRRRSRPFLSLLLFGRGGASAAITAVPAASSAACHVVALLLLLCGVGVALFLLLRRSSGRMGEAGSRVPLHLCTRTVSNT